jgi:carbonic anhydrase
MNAMAQLLDNNHTYTLTFAHAALSAPPRLRVAILTCMDARIDPARVLGLEPGDAHVIRNAGGIVTDDVLRSLSISQHHLGTEEIVVIQHTQCGLLTFSDEAFASDLERATGHRPSWTAGTFDDLDASVREGVRRIQQDPFIPRTQNVRGFVYDVANGRLRETSCDPT